MKKNMIFALFAALAMASYGQEMGGEAEATTENSDVTDGAQQVINTLQAPMQMPSAGDAETKVHTLLQNAHLRAGRQAINGENIYVAIGTAQSPRQNITEDGSFMSDRNLLALMAYLSAKSKICSTLSTTMSAETAMSIISESEDVELEAKRLAAIQKEQNDLAALEASIAVLDAELAKGVRELTFGDRFKSFLDGLIKKVDESYSPAQLQGERKVAYEEMLRQRDALKADLETRISIGAELKKEVQGIKNDLQLMSRMPLFGVTVLFQTESYDGKEYKLCVVVVWSEKLQQRAQDVLNNIASPSSNKGKYSLTDWVNSRDLTCMVGPCKYVDNEGRTYFVGIAGADLEGAIAAKAGKKRAAEYAAQQMVLVSLYSEIELAGSLKSELREYNDDSRTSLQNLSEKVMNTVKNQQISGITEIGMPQEFVHPMTRRKSFVTIYALDPEIAQESADLIRKQWQAATANAQNMNYKRGLQLGAEAALEGVKTSPTLLNRGMRDGAEQAMPVREPAAAPKVSVEPVPVQRNGANQGQGGATGVWCGNEDFELVF